MAKRVFTPEQREIRRLRATAWNLAHKGRLAELSRLWKIRNPERYALYVKNKVQTAEYKAYQAAFQRQWRAENPDKVKAAQKKWASQNLDSVCAKTHKRRALKLASGGTHTAADLRVIWQFQNGKCVYCQKPIDEDREIDHWVPLARGGSNDRINLQYLCMYHNGRKGDKDPLEYESSIGFIRTYTVGAAFATSPIPAETEPLSPPSPQA